MIARARAAVIAGDSRQLPPTAFFMGAVTDDQDTEGDESDLLTRDVESVLEAFNRALGGRWPTSTRCAGVSRSQDARLIAPSNAFFYDNRMTTFAGTLVEPPIDLVIVPDAVGRGHVASRGDRGGRPDAGARAATAHAVAAASSPWASTMPTRSTTSCSSACAASLSLRGWFDESRPEPYFVKNLEKVQGDERDAIILAIGYGRRTGRPDQLTTSARSTRTAATGGSMWRSRGRRSAPGAVNRFTADDLEPDKLRAEGPRRLADYLRFWPAAVGISPARPWSGRPRIPSRPRSANG